MAQKVTHSAPAYQAQIRPKTRHACLSSDHLRRGEQFLAINKAHEHGPRAFPRGHGGKARPWLVVIKLRSKPDAGFYESSVACSNGLIHVSLGGARVPRFSPDARLEGELRAARTAFIWLRHLSARSKIKVVLSPATCSVLWGEAACPPRLKSMRNQLLSDYASLPNVIIESGPLPPTQPVEQGRVAA